MSDGTFEGADPSPLIVISAVLLLRNKEKFKVIFCVTQSSELEMSVLIVGIYSICRYCSQNITQQTQRRCNYVDWAYSSCFAHAAEVKRQLRRIW
jgi:hydrogenase maturation factor HypF (carbamoyltransferase family)